MREWWELAASLMLQQSGRDCEAMVGWFWTRALVLPWDPWDGSSGPTLCPSWHKPTGLA